MKRKMLTFFVAVCFIVGMFPTAAFSAVRIIPLTQTATANLGFQLTDGAYQLNEDVEIDGSLKIPKNQTVILDLNGYGIQQKSGVFASVVYMEENSSLELNDSRATEANSLKFNGGYITDGTTTQDTITEAFSGGGVYVSSGAELTVNAGTICFCEATCAGGIYIASGGKTVMNGGEIKGCVAQTMAMVGGVYVSENAQLEMNGGKIDYCYGYNSGGGLFAVGVNNKGIMKMSGNARIDYGYLLRSSTDTSDPILTYGVENNGTLYAGGGEVYGFGNGGEVVKYGDNETDFYNSDEMQHVGWFDYRYILNNGTIGAGVFHQKLSSNGTISGGTFYEKVLSSSTVGIVTGGTFLGEVQNICTVTFETDGGSTAPEKQWRANASATKPKNPTKSGCLFEGWYNGAEKFDFTQNVTENITLTAHWSDPERFSLQVGGTYWFDLSDTDIPGEVNDGSHLEIGENLPDATLHYVPFTYVGTIASYALNDTEDKTTEENLRSVFLADANITVCTSWNNLHEKNLIYGTEYASGGVNYTMRAPSGGSSSTGSKNNMSGLPAHNDWDTVTNKDPNLIKTLNTRLSSQTLSFAQDLSASDSEKTVIRGKDCDEYRQKWMESDKNLQFNNVGYRPLLELPYTLEKTDVKEITLDFNGGSVGTSSVINMVVAAAKPFTAPQCGGIVAPSSNQTDCCWIDENGGIYAPGDSVPSNVTKLTARWLSANQAELILTETEYYAANCTGTLYIAAYSSAYSSNMLADVWEKEVGAKVERGKLADLELDITGADTIKLFSWKEELVPECANAVWNIKSSQ